MSKGNTKTQGNQGKNFPFQHNNLLSLGAIIANTASGNALLTAILAAVQNHQEYELLLVRDTGNGEIVQQRNEYDETTGTWSVAYYAADGITPYMFAGSPEYIDLQTVLSLMLTELQQINADIDVPLSTRASEATLAALNAKFNSLGQKVSADSHPVVLSTEQEAILQAMADALDVDLSTLATEATLALVNSNVVLGNITLNSLLTAFNAEDFATETTLLAAAADINDIEVLLTPAVRTHNTITATVAGSVPAGSISGSVFNSGNQPAGWNGTIIPAGVSIPWGPVGNRDTYGAIPYDPTISGPGTTLIIEYTT